MVKVYIHTHKRTSDAKPATDSERRDKIQQVVRLAECTARTAENYLECENWFVPDAVSTLKGDRKLGFVVDSVTDGKAIYVKDVDESALNQKVRAAYKKLTEAFAATGGSRGGVYKTARSEFIAANYEYHKAVGSWHPLAKEMD